MYSVKKALPYLLPMLGALGTVAVDVLLRLLAGWHPANATMTAIIATETPPLMALGDMLRAIFRSMETQKVAIGTLAPATPTAAIAAIAPLISHIHYINYGLPSHQHTSDPLPKIVMTPAPPGVPVQSYDVS